MPLRFTRELFWSTVHSIATTVLRQTLKGTASDLHCNKSRWRHFSQEWNMESSAGNPE